MAKRNQQVVPLGNAWAVMGEGSKRFTLITDTQRDAIGVARSIAKRTGTELIVFGKDGKLKSRDSFIKQSKPAVKRKH